MGNTVTQFILQGLSSIQPNSDFGGVVDTGSDLPEEVDSRIYEVFRYWQKIRGTGGRLPARGDIDPLDLPGRLWPHLMLSDLTEEPLSVTYRLVGTAVVDIDGVDFTGMRMEDLVHRRKFEDTLADYWTVAEMRLPHFRRASLYDARLNNEIEIERLHLPLASNGGDVDKILTVLLRLSNSQRSGARKPRFSIGA